MSTIVLYDQRDSVVLITLNRPEAMNAFTSQMSIDLLEALEKASEDEAVRAVVITGAGRSFSAGADLKQGLQGRNVFGKLQFEYRAFLTLIATMPKPVIAAVHGSVAGISTSLALQCDLLIMAEDAFMLSPFTTISLVPDGGLNWLLVRQLGYRRAYQLSIESERIPAARCVELGLANRSVPADQLLDSALGWADELTRRAPLSLAATKKVMRLANDHDWATCFDMEAELQRELVASDDNAEGVRAFFEKREPHFKGR
jgi:2-(1,2-epoxy-1,2-dihydrophenyl)acetyl-CoA isomerase